MDKQKVITVPNPKLRQRSKTVKKIDNKIKKTIKNLLDTVKAASDPEGIGLSAIQINQPVRIFVVKIEDKFEVFINPKIIPFKKTLTQILPKEKLFFEGCLSVPKIYGFVDRPYKIKINWQDEKGKKHKKTFSFKKAICLQHEMDHLNGILFTERILEQKGKLYHLTKDKNKKEIFEEITFI